MAKSFARVTHPRDAEEGEEIRALQASDESDDSSGETPVWRSRKVAQGAGVFLLGAAVVGAVLVLSGKSDLPSTKSAHHLFQSEEFHLAVKERVLKSASRNGQHHLDVSQVDQEIKESLGKVLNKLKQDFPEVYEKLKNVIPEDQSKALVKLLEREHDERLKALGEKAMKVIIQNALSGPKEIRKRLVEEFRPELPELEVLYKQIVPSSLRAAKKQWYASKKKSGVDTESDELDGSWEFLTHPNSIKIMKTFSSPTNTTGASHGAVTAVTAVERRLQAAPAPATLPGTWEQPMSVKLGVGITGFVLNSVNTLVIELSQLLHFKMPWWGWLLTLLPGVSLGTTSCLIAPFEKSYSDFWCVDFLMFTGLQALEVTINSAWQDMTSTR